MNSLTVEHKLFYGYYLFVTMTTSLLFFHMTVLKSVELPKNLKIFSIN